MPIKLKCGHTIKEGDILITDYYLLEILRAGGVITVEEFKGGLAYRVSTLPDDKNKALLENQKKRFERMLLDGIAKRDEALRAQKKAETELWNFYYGVKHVLEATNVPS